MDELHNFYTQLYQRCAAPHTKPATKTRNMDEFGQSDDSGPRGFYDPDGTYELDSTKYTITVLNSHGKRDPIRITAREFPLDSRCDHFASTIHTHTCDDVNCYRINSPEWPYGYGEIVHGVFKCTNSHCKGHRWPNGRCFGKKGVVKVEEGKGDWSNRHDWEKVFRERQVPEDPEINPAHWRVAPKGFFSKLRRG